MARRTVGHVQADIEKLARERQRLWFDGDGGDPLAAQRVSARLADLYEEKRVLQAGTDRDAIVKRARVETELERLMTG